MKLLDSFWTKNAFLILAYLFINFLFVYRYSARISNLCLTLSLLYSVIVVLAIGYVLGQRENFQILNKSTIYFSMVFLLAILYAAVMFHIDPFGTRVGRYPALQTFIQRLLDGVFPYQSGLNISGFPFLFVLLIPFYLIGELGIFQLFSFAVFAFIVHKRYLDDKGSYMILLMLALSPAFLYEVVVRSELFSNMVLIILFFFILERIKPIKPIKTLFLVGILAGFLLSTRGIVLLPYLIYFTFYFKTEMKSLVLFAVATVLGFAVTFLPFVLWNKELFVQNNPLVVQKSYIPDWLLILSALACIAVGYSIDAFRKVYRSASLVLFGVVFLCFVIRILQNSFNQAVFQSFDITYFCFCLPFLLLSFELERRSVPQEFGSAPAP
jgi:hypothetical protein